MKNLHRYFHYFVGIVFLAVIFIAIFGQDVNKGLTADIPEGGDVLTCTSFNYSNWGACQPNNTQYRSVVSGNPAGCVGGISETTKTCVYSPPVIVVPPPVTFTTQDVPLEFKPTAVPPGNNVVAPLNIGSAAQTKAGPLGASSFTAGSISSGPITAGTISASSVITSGTFSAKGLSAETLNTSGSAIIQGGLTLGGVLNFNGYQLKVEMINGGEDSYGGVWWCADANSDTCNGNAHETYTCAPEKNGSCTDAWFWPPCRERAGTYGMYGNDDRGDSSFRYAARDVTCVSRTALTITQVPSFLNTGTRFRN